MKKQITKNKIQEQGSSHLVLIGVISLIVLIIAGYFLLQRGIKLPSTSSNPSATTKPSTTPNYFLVSKTNNAEVSITNGKVTPKTIQVKVGSTVTFTNEDTTSYQLVLANVLTKSSDNLDTDITSDPLGKGSSFSYTFDKVGTFTFADKSNTTIKGTIIVVD